MNSCSCHRYKKKFYAKLSDKPDKYVQMSKKGKKEKKIKSMKKKKYKLENS